MAYYKRVALIRDSFYANQLVPTLRATIDSQAAYISDLLKQFGQDQGGKNG